MRLLWRARETWPPERVAPVVRRAERRPEPARTGGPKGQINGRPESRLARWSDGQDGNVRSRVASVVQGPERAPGSGFASVSGHPRSKPRHKAPATHESSHHRAARSCPDPRPGVRARSVRAPRATTATPPPPTSTPYAAHLLSPRAACRMRGGRRCTRSSLPACRRRRSRSWPAAAIERRGRRRAVARGTSVQTTLDEHASPGRVPGRA
jgi:hypothetical protein